MAGRGARPFGERRNWYRVFSGVTCIYISAGMVPNLGKSRKAFTDNGLQISAEVPSLNLVQIIVRARLTKLPAAGVPGGKLRPLPTQSG